MNKLYGIIAGVVFIIALATAGKADFEIEMGQSHKVNATVVTTVITEDGNEYITSMETKVVTMYDHHSDNPEDWTVRK